jgi:hypothetical protein
MALLHILQKGLLQDIQLCNILLESNYFRNGGSVSPLPQSGAGFDSQQPSDTKKITALGEKSESIK